MTTRTIREATKALQALFSAPKIPPALPPESRRLLQTFVDGNDGEGTEEDSVRANHELKAFWARYVQPSPQKLPAFVGVLRELQSAVVGEANILEWWEVIRPMFNGTFTNKTAVEDAREFLVGAMTFDDDDEDVDARAKTSSRLCNDLLAMYIARSRFLEEQDHFIAPENTQAVQQVEEVLVAFGKKRPKDFFRNVDDLVRAESTRLRALTLLSTFLRHQTPHLYLVTNTPLIEDLVKCLMNDTSTIILSVALTSLIMLLPHVPGSLGPFLPRLFLVYSRLLAWEKFSPLSTEAEKNLVTDDRVSNENEDEEEHSGGDVGIDPNWEIARPADGVIEATTPELMTYFTYLYGLYPLNFMSYIRKPRKYLKNAEFPGSDLFDLDQAIIRQRSNQFRQQHLLHENFYTLTIEEELTDPKWPKMDPADVVGDCHALCISSKPSLTNPGPPPTSKLPDVPPVPPLSPALQKYSGRSSPAASQKSRRSSPNLAPDDDSPIIKAQDARSYVGAFPAPPPTRSLTEKTDPPAQTNIEYLQQRITLLSNELNFERWHKAQYSSHIGQIMRKNVKDATIEAETLNLLNANRALKKQLEQVRKAREATIKDSALTRKQHEANSTNMNERFHRMRQEQDVWQAESDELRRLREETKQYRELLVATEARELNKTHQLELAQRDVESFQETKDQLQDAQRRLHEYEYREFEFETAVHEQTIMKNEIERLNLRIKQHEHERDRVRKVYADKIAELEAQLLVTASPLLPRASDETSRDTQYLVQQAVADTQARLVQLKKAHSRLLEKHTDLELDYQVLKSQLEMYQSNGYASSRRYASSAGDRSSLAGGDRSFSDNGYDVLSEYGNPPEMPQPLISSSDPTNRHYQMPMSPPISNANVHRTAGLTFQPPDSRSGTGSRSSNAQAASFNRSAPLTKDETKSFFSDGSGKDGQPKKEKIQPDSNLRVYGRGGAQNIKLKPKDSTKSESSSGSNKKGGFKALRGLV